jgi:hypothetical protein
MPRIGIAAPSIILPRLAFALVVTLAACGGESGPSLPPDLALVPVDSLYDFSVFATSAPGVSHRLVIVERGGGVLLRSVGLRRESACGIRSARSGGGQE